MKFDVEKLKKSLPIGSTFYGISSINQRHYSFEVVGMYLISEIYIFEIFVDTNPKMHISLGIKLNSDGKSFQVAINCIASKIEHVWNDGWDISMLQENGLLFMISRTLELTFINNNIK